MATPLKTTAERGYGAAHQALREQWAPRVATGTVVCSFPGCNQLIAADEEWDLGHDDDRSVYRGPEHRDCNRGKRPRAAGAEDVEKFWVRSF